MLQSFPSGRSPDASELIYPHFSEMDVKAIINDMINYGILVKEGPDV